MFSAFTNDCETQEVKKITTIIYYKSIFNSKYNRIDADIETIH